MSDAPVTPAPGTLRRCGEPDRLLIVFSDIEMGVTGPYDDFPHAEFLAGLIDGYSDARYAGLKIDLVFNGDTFDLLKTCHQGAYPHRITEAIACAKLAAIVPGHGPFFRAIERFLDRLGDRGTVTFVVGNHDAELLFPAVQSAVRQLVGGSERVAFPGLTLEIGRVHIEHGSQADPLFRIDPEKSFVRQNGEEFLALSWGAIALLDVAIPLQPLLYHHDRLKPKRMLFHLIPEIKELLTHLYWNYWRRDWWVGTFDGIDPVKRVTWSMITALTRRLATADLDVEAADDLPKRITHHDSLDLYMVGHLHEAAWWSYGRRKVLRTGALRDEFMLDASGVQTAVNKTYAEVWMSGDDVVHSHLVEVVAPERPRELMPQSIFDAVPEIRARLALTNTTRSHESLAQDAQRAQETAEVDSKRR